MCVTGDTSEELFNKSNVPRFSFSDFSRQVGGWLSVVAVLIAVFGIVAVYWIKKCR